MFYSSSRILESGGAVLQVLLISLDKLTLHGPNVYKLLVCA